MNYEGGYNSTPNILNLIHIYSCKLEVRKQYLLGTPLLENGLFPTGHKKLPVFIGCSSLGSTLGRNTCFLSHAVYI